MELNIQFRDPKSLVPYGNNSKKHPVEQIQAIAKSIKTFGFDQPIVIDSKGVIIKGHGRREAALLLEMPEVPVIIRDDVTETEARFLREVDNKIQSAEWDKENLASELTDLKDAGRLEFTLFTEDSIPDLPQMNISTKPEPFDLTTKHTCVKCEYKW
jgi:ParB-like chromosome segregation protein Spo0J